jgi:hypothetical protein
VPLFVRAKVPPCARAKEPSSCEGCDTPFRRLNVFCSRSVVRIHHGIHQSFYWVRLMHVPLLLFGELLMQASQPESATVGCSTAWHQRHRHVQLICHRRGQHPLPLRRGMLRPLRRRDGGYETCDGRCRRVRRAHRSELSRSRCEATAFSFLFGHAPPSPLVITRFSAMPFCFSP